MGQLVRGMHTLALSNESVVEAAPVEVRFYEYRTTEIKDRGGVGVGAGNPRRRTSVDRVSTIKP